MGAPVAVTRNRCPNDFRTLLSKQCAGIASRICETVNGGRSVGGGEGVDCLPTAGFAAAFALVSGTGPFPAASGGAVWPVMLLPF